MTLTPCEQCGYPALHGNSMCWGCWYAWWASMVERSRIQRIAAAARRGDS